MLSNFKAMYNVLCKDKKDFAAMLRVMILVFRKKEMRHDLVWGIAKPVIKLYLGNVFWRAGNSAGADVSPNTYKICSVLSQRKS